LLINSKELYLLVHDGAFPFLFVTVKVLMMVPHLQEDAVEGLLNHYSSLGQCIAASTIRLAPSNAPGAHCSAEAADEFKFALLCLIALAKVLQQRLWTYLAANAAQLGEVLQGAIWQSLGDVVVLKASGASNDLLICHTVQSMRGHL